VTCGFVRILVACSARRLPDLNELEAALPALIQAAKRHFASPPMTATTFLAGEKKPKEAKAKREKAS
jgi:hypothetical protein